jgi:hypothetical protein
LVLGFAEAAPRSAADIPPAYRRVALAHSIPADIFYAVALAESGRRVGEQSVPRPWPWTLNIHGEGIYFGDRRSAWRAATAAIAKQQTSVDIGLMQVNWRYHHRRLLDPWNALDPYRNLQVAAEILADCQQRLRDWWQSVGCYHAPSDPDHAERYRARVRAHWQSLVGS